MPHLILLDLELPLIGAMLWRFMAGGWAIVAHGIKTSETWLPRVFIVIGMYQSRRRINSELHKSPKT